MKITKIKTAYNTLGFVPLKDVPLAGLRMGAVIVFYNSDQSSNKCVMCTKIKMAYDTVRSVPPILAASRHRACVLS